MFLSANDKAHRRRWSAADFPLGGAPCWAIFFACIQTHSLLYSSRMGKYFTTDKAASYLGVTPSRIRQYIAEQRLPSEKYGRDHMIKERDLEYFARNGKKKRGRPLKTIK